MGLFFILDELNQIYLNKAKINATATVNGGMTIGDVTYWTSTEFNIGDHSSAVIQDFGFGIPGNLTKFGTAYVRAIREF